MIISKLQRIRMRHGVMSALLTMPAMAWSAWDLNLHEGVTPYSRVAYDLHMLILWICVFIGTGVFGMMFWSILKFRKSKGAVAAHWHENTTVEVIWTTIPFLILVGLAVPATNALIMMEDVSESELTVKVTGYQWKWHYDYLDEGIAFFSTLAQDSNVARRLDSGIDPSSVPNYLLEVDNELVLPTNTKIRILTTAGDVIHSWWVPVLGWKRDAIPGFINESWTLIEQPGVYRGQCAELCGKDHGFMPIVIRALPKDEYRAWAEQRKLETSGRGSVGHEALATQ